MVFQVPRASAMLFGRSVAKPPEQLRICRQSQSRARNQRRSKRRWAAPLFDSAGSVMMMVKVMMMMVVMMMMNA